MGNAVRQFTSARAMRSYYVLLRAKVYPCHPSTRVTMAAPRDRVPLDPADERQAIATAIRAIRAAGRATTASIQASVADSFGITTAEMFGSKRCRALVRPRQIAMVLCLRFRVAGIYAVSFQFERNNKCVYNAVERVGGLVEEVLAEVVG